MGRVAKVPRTLAGPAETHHQLAARVDHQHREIPVGPVSDVQIAPGVESDGCDAGQQFPVAHAVPDSVDLGEAGGQNPVFQGEFDGILGPRRPAGQGQHGKRNPDRAQPSSASSPYRSKNASVPAGRRRSSEMAAISSASFHARSSVQSSPSRARRSCSS